jgi:hypothetical protein
MDCPHSKIEAALDRWSECHWHIHQIEGNYHSPDLFRYSLNSFIRAIKEIPQILKMELQNSPEYKKVHKLIIDSLKSDELLSLLSKKRDFIVHQGMLNVLSSGVAGTTEGRGIKMAVGFKVEPYETTEEAYEKFKYLLRKNPVVRGAVGPDSDSWPMIRREWKVPELDNELLEVAITAWKLCGEAISKIVVKLGGEPLDLSFPCRHDPERVKTMEFSQQEFFESVDGVQENA